MIDNLNEKELLSLRNDIEKRLKDIKDEETDVFNRKNSVKNKTKLSELTNKDRIFSIHFSHKDNKVYSIDYCNVDGISGNSGNGYYNISISHKRKPIGLTASFDEDENNNGCFLSLGSSVSSFHTIKPKNWEDGLQKSLQIHLKHKKERYEKEVLGIKQIISNIISSNDDINKFIKSKK